MWSDPQKWWMDFIRSLLVFGIASVITVGYLDSIQEKRDLELKISLSEYQENREKIRALEDASFQYFAVAYDAYYELLNGKTRQNSPIVQRFQDESWDEYNRSITRIESDFQKNPAIRSKVQDLRNLIDCFFNSFREKDQQTFSDYRKKAIRLNSELVVLLKAYTDQTWKSS